MPNNIDFVAFLERIYNRGDCYILGGFGNTLTQKFIDAKCAQYSYNQQNKATLIANMGKIAHDCYGMLKAFLWGNEDGGGRYNAAQDRNEDMAIKAATEKGLINTIPKMLGVAVWKTGHVGFVVDHSAPNYQDWIVIEDYSIPRGILRRRLSEGGWTQWFKDTYLEYKETPVQEDNNMGTLPQPIKYFYSDPSDPSPLLCHSEPNTMSLNGQSFPHNSEFEVVAIQDYNGHSMAKTAKGWASLGTPGNYWATPVIPKDLSGEVAALKTQVANLTAQNNTLKSTVSAKDTKIANALTQAKETVAALS